VDSVACARCGAAIAGKAIVCYRCGAPTAVEPVARRAPVAPPRRALAGPALVIGAGLVIGLARSTPHRWWLAGAAVAAGAAWGLVLRRPGRGV
jgi:hypothetical protein